MKRIFYKIFNHAIHLSRNGLIGLCLFFSFTSCEDYVNVDLPKTHLTGEAVFSNTSTADAALLSIYSNLRDEGMLSGGANGLGIRLGNYADELEIYNSYSPVLDFYNNNISPPNEAIHSIWNTAYNEIYSANRIYEGVSNSSTLSGDNKDRLMGESLFLRALIHFYLVNLYGEIPYVSTTDYPTNTNIAKSPVSTVYENIISDLQVAQNLLPLEYQNNERIKPGYWAATALLARVFLYNQQWQQAEQEATKVIENNRLFALEPPSKTFLKASTGTIWEFSANTDGGNTLEAQNFVFYEGPPPNWALTSEQVNAFEPDDLRLENWVGKVSDSTNTWYYPKKYKLVSNSGTEENSIVLRLSEQYLIRSESRARQSDFSGAANDLNRIRSRAGLPNLTLNSIDEAVVRINKERRVEFFTEFGHRFFDLKRTGKTTSILSAVKPNWESTDILFPLPERELLLDPNLQPQNPGY